VLSLKSNGLGVDGGKALAEGLKGNQVITELNIADNNLADYARDMSGVVALADVIPDMGALSVLNLDENGLLLAGCKAICDVLKSNTTVISLSMKKNGFQAKSAQAIAEMLSDNGALTSLNLSSNALGAKGATRIAEAIKVTNFAIAVVLVPFSCPSDHWLNCCCLLLSTG
jgi:Ran GTPase-activating protein (RanGAP) involved in mRNA processing and transport